MRFADAVQTMTDLGVTRFLEVGPDGILTAMVQDIAVSREGTALADPGAAPPPGDGIADADADGVVALAAMRRDRSEVETLLAAVAELFVSGVDVDWPALFGGAGAGTGSIDLPTYAFQHRHFWPRQRPAGVGDVAGLGLSSTGHPVLGAAVSLPDSPGPVFTGWLSTGTHPWLADHVVYGRVLVPGTALLEMVLAAGERVGAPVVAELLLRAPLVLPARGGVQVRVTVGEGDADGTRAVTVHSRSADDEPWTVHATGVLAGAGNATGVADDDFDLAVWPPEGAEEVALDGLYDALAGAGLEYGPVFRGLRRAWRLGTEVYAEAVLTDGAGGISGAGGSRGFAVQPVLLDAVLHAIGAADLLGDAGTVRLPFAFAGVRVFGPAESVLRARLTLGEGSESVRLWLADGSGLPVVLLDGLTLRPAARDRFSAGVDAAARLLYGLDWVG
ncbi:polyketide synthase dehydratase domain-containing protein, partial [Parafrankia elaeagni]|uniref:polyketide synthase dehydratase domain-containing protein n=1 Tax=Parafrankia elaeagni TaxID=222534 RepID=UPI001E38174E